MTVQVEWANRRVLVVVAHPDDEVLGCGATIAKLAESGAHVTVLLATKRDDPRGVLNGDILRSAFEKSCQILGARAEVVATPSAEERGDETSRLHDTLLPWIDNADMVLTHWHGDTHQAHRKIARAIEIATRPFRRQRDVLLFEVPTSTDQAFVQTFSPNLWVVVERKHCEAAMAAMKNYGVEYEIGRRPIDVKRHLKMRGTEISAPYAEAFEVVRGFW